ncbi:hypothetical protein NKR23_g6222 [Pleurostoma richardsiae]|uniref:N-acetyltransferase domain-containing protein n=1 Tax=Pleurostoma richardsiae TaxID=41990 RepID=A0AA38VPN7_9PEZI|nr:hypothetical protein NKR23_g6222 [Pleurostoma richardsiae]
MVTVEQASTDATSNAPFRVGFPASAAAAADDADLVKHLTLVVNAVYAEDERAIWEPATAFVRTNEEQVAQYLRDGELALAWRTEDGEPASASVPGASRVMGCMRLHRMDSRTYQIGMLVSDPRFRGAGVGRELMRFAEAHAKENGAEVAQVELLVPQHFVHPFKVRLEAWYTRLGYELTGTGDFAVTYPQLVSILSGPTTFKIMEKPLR